MSQFPQPFSVLQTLSTRQFPQIFSVLLSSASIIKKYTLTERYPTLLFQNIYCILGFDPPPFLSRRLRGFHNLYIKPNELLQQGIAKSIALQVDRCIPM